jgi:hypothetical protein
MESDKIATLGTSIFDNPCIGLPYPMGLETDYVIPLFPKGDLMNNALELLFEAYQEAIQEWITTYKGILPTSLIKGKLDD